MAARRLCRRDAQRACTHTYAHTHICTHAVRRKTIASYMLTYSTHQLITYITSLTHNTYTLHVHKQLVTVFTPVWTLSSLYRRCSLEQVHCQSTVMLMIYVSGAYNTYLFLETSNSVTYLLTSFSANICTLDYCIFSYFLPIWNIYVNFTICQRCQHLWSHTPQMRTWMRRSQLSAGIELKTS